MTDRIKRMRERQQKKNEICIERFKIYAKSNQETAGEAEIMRRAQFQYNLLTQIPIFIEEDELFAGHGASRPRGLEIDPNNGIWDETEVAALISEGYGFNKEDEQTLYELNKTVHPYGLNDGVAEAVRDNEELTNFMKAGITLPPWKSFERGKQLGGGYAMAGLGLGPGQCLVCYDYAGALNKGLNAVIRECVDRLEKITFTEKGDYDKCLFLKAMKLSLEGVVEYAARHAELARKMAETESDSERKKELLTIADMCSHVPGESPRTFLEAVQMYWILFLTIGVPNITAGMGRVDQILYPYYKADIEAGRITDEEVIEIFEMIRVQNMDLGSLGGKSRRECEDGEAKWHNMTIGGVKPDGSDATNELSYLILEALLRCPTPHHTITIRVADSTPLELILKGLECQRRGLSMPAFVSDDSYINFFVQYGADIEDARDYCMTGCLDGNIPGRSRSMTASMFVVPLFLTTFLNDGKDVRTGLPLMEETGDLDRFSSFEEFESEFRKAFAKLLSTAHKRCNLQVATMQKYFPEPLRSAFMNDCIEQATDYQELPMKFENGEALCPIGMVNLGNSLYAIKKLVFEDKSIKLSELKKALDADWEGFEELRETCLNLPKYGNNIPEVDDMVAAYYQFLIDLNDGARSILGAPIKTTAVSITTHQPGGMLTFATPDGRKAHTILADGAASPMMGQDTHGPLAMLSSAMKIPQDKYQGVLLNMKFHPSALKTDEDMNKLAMMIRTYFKNGGKHIQFNVTSRERLIKAQEKPEENKDILVRVAGYSAYFVDLTRPMQNELIERTTNEAIR